MNSLDIILIVLMLGIVVWETLRGFGRACFDALALYAALWITSLIYMPIAHGMPASGNPASAQAVAFGGSFFVTGIIALVISYYVWDVVQLNMGMADKAMGVVAGVAVALILAHGLVRTVYISGQNSDAPSVIASNSLGEQVLNFDSYHAAMDGMSAFTGGRRNVNVN